MAQSVYTSCPELETEHFLLRLVSMEDCENLLKVYSDQKAVPLFNSDNCHGDDFCYTTSERMEQAIRFWLRSYQRGEFVRLSIVDKGTGCAVGTFERFFRTAGDFFTNCELLRLDLRSDYERREVIEELLRIIRDTAAPWFGSSMVATKAIPAAGERIQALEKAGFVRSSQKLVGHDGTEYGDYFCLFIGDMA